MRPELLAALPSFGERLRFTVVTGRARRAGADARPRRWRGGSRGRRRIALPIRSASTAPALLVTGEPGLDRVVPVDVTRRYLDDFDRAEHVVLERTGHLGLVTRPDAFAGVLERFVNGARLSA